ncbi:MAG: hypothetical protein SCH98_12145 [Deferrisomatales bacterium]|nr:hypothetical protein [Deferrisomatales bacterium]
MIGGRARVRSFLWVVLAAAAAAALLSPAVAGARDDRDRVRFYGWVESMPEGLHGTWVIGGRQVVTGPGTRFDQTDGPLVVGGCAKVDVRGGAVHEIDSEPPEDCR